MTQPITATTAADILAYFPHALGFEPRESFGFITLQGRTVGASLRIDVPDESVRPADFAQTATHYLLADESADAVLMMLYTNEPAADPGTKPYNDYAAAIRTELETNGLEMRDGWLITDAGWSNYFCEDPECCTVQPLSTIRDSAMSAEMVYAGSVKRADRAADPAYIGNEDTARNIWATVPRYLNTGGLEFSHPAFCAARRAWHEALGTTPGETEAVELIASLLSNSVRDRILIDAITTTEDPQEYKAVITGQYDGQPDWSRVDATEDLLIHLLAYAPGETRTPLFCFLGWLSWYKGRASLATAYIAKGLDADPKHRLASLLMQLLQMGKLPEVATKPSTAYQTPLDR